MPRIRLCPSIYIFLLAATVLMVQGIEGVRAASIESLVMPGEVIEGHAKYEEECKNCHKRFDKGAQTGQFRGIRLKLPLRSGGWNVDENAEKHDHL